jgi:hypothetical protein
MSPEKVIELAKQFCPYYTEELRGAYYDGFVKASKLVAQYERFQCIDIAWNNGAVEVADAIRERGQA